MSDTLTIGQVAEALHCHERAARKLLQAVAPGIDAYTEDPSEPVSRDAVIDLFAIRAGDSVGRHLAPLLSATMPKGSQRRVLP